LSYASPTVPIEGLTPISSQRLPNATQFGLAHQPFNSLVIDTQTHVAQLSLHTGTPVGAIAHNVDLPNALRHDSVVDAALTGWA
jgi:hypothetical protein